MIFQGLYHAPVSNYHTTGFLLYITLVYNTTLVYMVLAVAIPHLQHWFVGSFLVSASFACACAENHIPEMYQVQGVRIISLFCITTGYNVDLEHSTTHMFSPPMFKEEPKRKGMPGCFLGTATNSSLAYERMTSEIAKAEKARTGFSGNQVSHKVGTWTTLSQYQRHCCIAR